MRVRNWFWISFGWQGDSLHWSGCATHCMQVSAVLVFLAWREKHILVGKINRCQTGKLAYFWKMQTWHSFPLMHLVFLAHPHQSFVVQPHHSFAQHSTDIPRCTLYSWHNPISPLLHSTSEEKIVIVSRFCDATEQRTGVNRLRIAGTWHCTGLMIENPWPGKETRRSQ